MERLSRNATRIRWSLEAVGALAILAGSAFYLYLGGNPFGVWGTIASLEGVIWSILLLAYLELITDPFLHHREWEFMHPVIRRMIISSVILVVVSLIAYLATHQYKYYLFYSIIFAVVFFVVDFTMLCMVVWLLLILL